MLHTTNFIVHKDMKIIKFHVCIDVREEREKKSEMSRNYA